MRVASQMRELASRDEGIRQARAAAEVQFRRQERPSEWKKQPIDVSTWKLGEPTKPLPDYWEAGIQYAATLSVAYADAVALRGSNGDPISDPELFRCFLDHGPSIAAEWAYDQKLRRYTGVGYREQGMVPGRFCRDVADRISDQLAKLEEEVWRRHHDAICDATAAEISPGRPAVRPASKKPRKKPHPNPEELLANRTAVTYERAAEVLQVTVRRVRELVAEGKLKSSGQGQNKRIEVAGIRERIGI